MSKIYGAVERIPIAPYLLSLLATAVDAVRRLAPSHSDLLAPVEP